MYAKVKIIYPPKHAVRRRVPAEARIAQEGLFAEVRIAQEGLFAEARIAQEGEFAFALACYGVKQIHPPKHTVRRRVHPP